jgi:hypothetical protein
MGIMMLFYSLSLSLSMQLTHSSAFSHIAINFRNYIVVMPYIKLNNSLGWIGGGAGKEGSNEWCRDGAHDTTRSKNDYNFYENVLPDF